MLTDQYDRPLSEITPAPAALKACAECPWRASTRADLEARRTDTTFSRGNLTQHWKSLVEDGSTCACHLTTPGYYEFTAENAEAGLKEPRRFKGEQHRQCAGQLVMVRRELEKMVTYDSHADYITANPTGLTAEVAAKFYRLWEDPTRSAPAFRWPQDDGDVLDPADLVDTSSMEWTMDRHTAADVCNVMELMVPSLALCECRFCSQHEQIHEAEEVTLHEGTAVMVDRGVAPVVQAFAAAGVATSGSCEDFAPAIREMDLHSFLILRDTPSGHVNYSTPLTVGGAFVRFSCRSDAGQAVASALAERWPVDRHATVAQVTFPATDAEKVASIITSTTEKRTV